MERHDKWQVFINYRAGGQQRGGSKDTCDSLIAEAWENVTDSEPDAHAERGNENTITST